MTAEKLNKYVKNITIPEIKRYVVKMKIINTNEYWPRKQGDNMAAERRARSRLLYAKLAS